MLSFTIGDSHRTFARPTPGRTIRFPGAPKPTPKPAVQKPETRHPKPEALNPNEARRPKPEARSPKPEARKSTPETRNPKPGTRNPTPESRNPKLETRNPKPGPETRNPAAYMKSELQRELSGNEVRHTACSLLVMSKSLCSKVHCHKVLIGTHHVNCSRRWRQSDTSCSTLSIS